MPRTRKPKLVSAARNGPPGEVLTLAEAAAYLRLGEAAVLRLVEEQALPARRLGDEWRLLKSAIQEWLKTPAPSAKKEGIWAWAGAFKDDPHWQEIVEGAYRRRGRPLMEEG